MGENSKGEIEGCVCQIAPLLGPFPPCLVGWVHMMGYPFTPSVDGTLWVCFGPPWSLVVGHIPWVGPLRVGAGSLLFISLPWWWRFKASRRGLKLRISIGRNAGSKAKLVQLSKAVVPPRVVSRYSPCRRWEVGLDGDRGNVPLITIV